MHSGPVLPLYFQWKNGQDFHFQGQSSLGGSYQQWLPNVEPINTVTSDLKSHFFNALFIGNLTSLQAGKAIADTASGGNPEKYNLSISLNYLALMGFDYGKYSFGLGPYYPVYNLSTENNTLQILAAKASPAFRFQYTEEKTKLRLLYSQTSYDQLNPTTSNLLYRDGSSNEVNRFSFKAHILRAGFDYQVDEDFTASLDEVLALGKYKASTDSLDQEFSFRHLYTSASLQRDMGDYVFVQLVGNYYMYKYETKISNGNPDSHDGTDFKLGVVFGLLF